MNLETLQKNNARLVVHGYTEQEGIDFDDTLAQLPKWKQSDLLLHLHHTCI